MHATYFATRDDHEWLADQFESLTTKLEVITPSVWAERKRYLSQSVTSMPGRYRYEVSPYLREIVDCLSVTSPVREVALMKGVQIGATTGVLENFVGYVIEHVKSAPTMLVTADAELAKLRIESYITPMLQLSGLDGLIKSSDENNPRKTGKTDKKLEWVGGGFLVPFGAINANKLRSISIQFMLRDEIDGWPDQVGKDGDPISLSASRTNGYLESRKILDISTPLIEGSSKIQTRFRLGDQRYYHVCCLACGFPQVLRWSYTDPNTGAVGGIVWDYDEHGNLDENTVRYLCQSCGHAHTNDDKSRLLSPAHGAEWRPTATPSSPHIRSYHLSALYSPVGMQTWAACVRAWLEAWDVEKNTVRDTRKLQVFYNNILGEPFKIFGESVRADHVSQHRRTEYHFGEVPNRFAIAHCGGPVVLVNCAVDVHSDNLAVGVFGWTRERRVFLIEYDRFEGDTSNIEDPSTWGRLRELIEQRVYTADDGKKYRIVLTLVDSGYQSDEVYRFAADYDSGVYPVKGQPPAPRALKEFSPFVTSFGKNAFGITVDLYKDRWSSALRRSWSGVGLQPSGHFNAPVNVTDKQLKELTVEVRQQLKDAATGNVVGHRWYRPSGAKNELWDTLVYASAGLDMLARDVCISQLGGDSVVWSQFFDLCEQQRLFMA